MNGKGPVSFGERARLARAGRRPADQRSLEEKRRLVLLCAPKVIGETPMTATETVALPISN